jgi:predicted metal-dependent HD superfamily phosphohydrolase
MRADEMPESTEQELRLKDRWLASFSEDAPADLVDTTGDDLIDRWSEPHRRYHTLTHLERMLDVVDDYGAHARDPQSVALACWFHDAVNDPTRHDNENESAELAQSLLPDLAVDPAEVVRLVLLTASHDVADGDRDGELLVDADLAILASDPVAYRDYTEAIRAEYSHVSNEAFGRGRAAVLRRLLALPRLFHVPELRTTWEARARANLTAELNALDDGGRPV